jgi:hypothetical protein
MDRRSVIRGLALSAAGVLVPRRILAESDSAPAPQLDRVIRYDGVEIPRGAVLNIEDAVKVTDGGYVIIDRGYLQGGVVALPGSHVIVNACNFELPGEGAVGIYSINPERRQAYHRIDYSRFGVPRGIGMKCRYLHPADNFEGEPE